MNSREMLYRTVLQQGSATSVESPTLFSRDLSPMSSLALSFHHAAPFSNSTPRRKLSLNSTTSDTSFASCELSFGKPQENKSMEEQGTPMLMSPTRKFIREKEQFASPRSEESSLMSPPPAVNLLSPSRKMMARDKENFPSPYFSPSHSTHIPHRPRSSPLQDVQNTVNRNLTFSPMKKKLQMISPTKLVLSSPQKPSPPDDFDTNSQDSGYSESGKKLEDACFSAPVSCAPRKLNLDLSPPKPRTLVSLPKTPSCTTITSQMVSTPLIQGTISTACDYIRKPVRRFSLNKADEEDSMLMDLLNDSPNKDDQPLGFSSLLSAPIQKESTPFDNSFLWRPTIKRCLSMVDITPTSSRIEPVISSEQVSQRYGRFKRPDAPVDLSGCVEFKRRREDFSRVLSPLSSATPTSVGSSPLTQRQVSAPEPVDDVPKPKIVRSHSESHVSIMKALNKCSNHNGELTGDFSKPIALPTIEGGKHPDLKAIDVDTMASLLKGKYSQQIASFKILDCRYPYEYEGGHIIGAEMFHHPKMVIDHLMAQKGAPVVGKEGTPRHVLIFHCEFSAERGPKAQRLLRETDRATNKEHYPALHFPETYLLEGGYKAFFEKYPELCTPKCYVRMLDSNHAEDLKHFRGKSKSWQAENKQSKCRNTLPRTGLKRLGL
ncbi:M-phase inducer phosphatase-like [Palaemon carinicauda]|uniref:M-phase inducer phosphatase-like n=1 Tax=Palaemon carinicauda TaxID=392227 RepID=UPI0035B6661C